MNILEQIVQHKRNEYADRAARTSLAELRSELRDMPAPRDFAAALRNRPAIIAEIKRRSPSRGEFRSVFDVSELAQAYRRGGAAAISVLTDAEYFGAQPADLAVARNASGLPVLRKDFLITEYMLVESRLIRADAVLLIAAILPGAQLAEMIALAGELSLASLVEVHSEHELARALDAGAPIIGINARDLRSFTVDLPLTCRLAQLVPPGVQVVAESGIRSRADIEMLRASGIGAFLIGESLLTAADPARMLSELLLAEAAV